MKPRAILIIAGVALAFGLGMWIGSRISLRSLRGGTNPAPRSSSRPSGLQSGNLPACVDFRSAASLIGQRGCVSGVVQRVYIARTGNTFMDFCADYRNCPFTSVVFASDSTRFGDLQSLQGRRVEIRGDIVDYQGHAEIVIRDPQQVRGAP